MLYVLCWDTSTLSSTCVVVLTGWLCSSWEELDSRIPLFLVPASVIAPEPGISAMV